MKAAFVACSCVLVASVCLSVGGYTQWIVAAFVASVLAALTGVEAYWAGEIARRAEARQAADASA